MAIYSEFFPLKMVIFHSYVSLPEGKENQSIWDSSLQVWRWDPSGYVLRMGTEPLRPGNHVDLFSDNHVSEMSKWRGCVRRFFQEVEDQP